MSKKIFIITIFIIIFGFLSFFIYRNYKERILPSDVPLGNGVVWSKPVMNNCEIYRDGNRVDISSYEIISNPTSAISLTYYQDIMTKNNWSMVDAADGTIAGSMTFEKGKYIVGVLGHAYPEGDPNSEYGIFSIFYRQNK